MTGGDCQGPCNGRARKEQAKFKSALADWDKAMAEREEGDPGPPRPVPPDIRPWQGEPVFCLRCQGALRTKLAELDDLAALLAAIPGLNGPADSAGKVSGSKGKRSPSPFGDDLLELEDWLRNWESLTRLADPGARRGYLASVITTLTHQLVQQFDRIICNGDFAADFGSELSRWHATLSAKAHAGPGIKHQQQKCPLCKEYSLWRSAGEEYIRCVNTDCLRLMSLDEYDALTDDAVA